MIFNIYGVNSVKYEYTNADKVLFEKLYNTVLPKYKNDLGKVTTTDNFYKLDNITKALQLLQCNVPSTDFKLNSKLYVVKILTYMLNNE